MNAVTNTCPNAIASSAYSAYQAFTSSAIQTDTTHYVFVDESISGNIIKEDNGKYSIFDVADWFLSKAVMTHKKLQKLCYYAQAWCFALKGYRLENTEYEAWVHGPVSPALWERFKSFGFDPIHFVGKAKNVIEQEDVEFLEDVWDTYGEQTGNSLEALTHHELPWIEARRGYEPEEKCSVVISPSTMASFYKSIYCGN